MAANAASRNVANESPTSADLIGELRKLKAKISVQEKKLKDFKSEKTELEKQIMESLDSQGLTKASDSKNTVSITESDVPNVEDWDAFYTFVRKNDAFFLLYRRVNSASYREMMKTRRNRKMPGVNTVTVRSLSFTKK
jgi:hypothetical protein